MRSAAVIAAFLFAAPFAAPAQTAPDHVVPERRAVLAEGLDFYGSDLRTILDTTLDACERSCLADSQCVAFTYNSRAGSCFPKSALSEVKPYAGAISGRIAATAPAVLAAAPARAAELLGFLNTEDLERARNFAAEINRFHVAGEWQAQDHIAAADRARRAGDPVTASRHLGAAVGVSDDPGLWIDYAAQLLAVPAETYSEKQDYFGRAAVAAINGYLRADSPALRATALVTLAQALETLDRGQDMVPALRLAQNLQPRDDTAARLDAAIGKYGFRITEHEVQADSTRPRICAVFSDELAKAGVDYTPFVKLPSSGLSVEAQGYQLCVGGLEHGTRYTLTFRAGLPAADGEKLAKDVEIAAYVRDRAPAVRFPGRAYVLPRGDSIAIPVETVNTKSIDLTLSRVSDRNLIRSIQNDYFGRPLDANQEDAFTSDIAEEVWRGAADVALEVNRDVTTRLPLDEVAGGLPAGIYALRAAIPGADPYDTPAATQWFVISDLGLSGMTGTDGFHIFARSLSTAGPKVGVKVSLLSRSNRVLGEAVTDAQGYAHFAPGLTRGKGAAAPALAMVEDGDTDISFLPLTDPEFDLSDRGVAGREPAPPVDVFLTTDRGAYRAGEVVNVTALTRDGAMRAIPGLPLTARLMRPDGVEYSRAIAADAGAGGHVFALPVGAAAPRGLWRLDIFSDPEAAALASRTFLVEDFLPERIDFALSVPDTIRLGDMPEVGIAAKYLFGAPAADLAVEGEVLLRAAAGLAAFPGYSFGLHDEPFEARMESFEGARTDAGGNATIQVILPDATDPGRPLEAELRIRVAEGSGRPVERREVVAIAPAETLIGVKPLFDGTVAERSEARFDLLAIGPDLKPASLPARWTLDRVETQYQWYQMWGMWNWEPVTTRTRVAEGEVALTASGPAALAVAVDWGRYELRVTAENGAGTSLPFSAGWYAAASATETPDMLELSLDKPRYAAGDTARLRIVPKAAGTALVTVLSNRVIDMKTVAVNEGENLIDLPVTDAWGTGAYVTVSALRPMDAAAGRNPARALGLAHAAVDPGARRLAAAFEVPAEADPRAVLPVALRVSGVAEGQTAWATIAAVDVGILNLTAFKSPDPEGHYFGQRKLGVGIRDLYGRLIDGLNGAMGTVRSGGDAGAGARLKADPPTEELVAFFSGPVQVQGGYARTEFPIPAFNGTVRLMAVVWSEGAVGQAEADVLVRDPVVVTASLPRFLAPGDRSRLLLEVTHATGPAGRMGLDVTGSEGVTIAPGAPSGVDLAEGEKKTLSLPLTATAVGVQTVRVALTTPDGKVLTKTLSLPVRQNDPAVSHTARFDLAAGATFTLDDNVFTGLRPGTATATLAVGPIARFDGAGLLQALDLYPWGCTEQLASRAMPLLYFEEVARAMALPGRDDIRTRVDQAIAEVLVNQSASGSFGLWSPGSGDLWLDSYVTDFLSRARKQGFRVPDLAFRMALDNLRGQLNYAADFDADGGPYAYAMMVLAREGAASIDDLRYYADVKPEAFDTPLASAQLGAALASYGDQRRADAMFARAGAMLDKRLAEKEEPRLWRADYGSNRRDAAAVLTLALGAGSGAVDEEKLASYIATRPGAQTASTQEATWTLMATHALIDRPGAEGFTLNGAPVAGPLVKVIEDQARTPVAVKNGSARDSTLTLTTFGVPEVPEPAGGRGYAISRTYYTMEGEEVAAQAVKPGTRLVAVLEVTPTETAEARLIVTDPLPAGLEIDNPNLIAGGDIATLDWLDSVTDVRHAEFRQDRFTAAVDWRDDAPFRLAYIVRAVSPGDYHHPAASVEDMYRPEFRAIGDTGRLTVSQ